MQNKKTKLNNFKKIISRLLMMPGKYLSYYNLISNDKKNAELHQDRQFYK